MLGLPFSLFLEGLDAPRPEILPPKPLPLVGALGGFFLKKEQAPRRKEKKK